MPTNKAPFTFHLDELTLQKIKKIAKNETRSTSNLLEHLCRLCIIEYESRHGELKIREIDE
jgi:hypothetical protein